MRSRLAVAPAPHPRWPWIVAVSLAVIGAAGFIPSARAAGARMLSLFRVTQVTALPLNLDSSAPLASGDTGKMLGQLFSDEVTVTRDDKTQAVPSALAASQLAGFSVRVPPSAQAVFRVRGEKDFQMLVDRNRAQTVLDSAGLTGVSLPASLDGATIAVRLPRTVHVMLGDCAPRMPDDAAGVRAPLARGSCTTLGEGPSPTVSVPPGLDMEKIAEVGLQLLGMSASEARQYCRTVDWRSTLVIPFPRSEAQSRNVGVDGVQGILLTHSDRDGAANYMLLWSRQGMLYSIAGPGDGSQGLTLAAELPPA